MKNIVLAKNGVEQTLNNVKKLSTNELDGGSCTWVPMDEANDYADFDTLSVSENGTYSPEEGYAGYDSVSVDVDPKTGSLDVEENGHFYASQEDDEIDGYTNVHVDVPPDYTTLPSKTLEQNGVYYASEDGVTGWETVTVDVPLIGNLGGGFASENGTYDAHADDLDGYDYFSVDVTHYEIEDPLGGEDDFIIDIGDDGTFTIEHGYNDETGIYTIDPEDGTSTIIIPGDEGDTAITVDGGDSGGGTVTQTPIPYTMAITTPPTKLTYNAGETIDYSGMVVHLYNRDYSVFTNGTYTTGEVPAGEQERPVTIADGTQYTQTIPVRWHSWAETPGGLIYKRFPPNMTFADAFTIHVGVLPDYIEIVTLPTKLTYSDGETIDLTGLVCVAKLEDGTTWTSAEYPNGHVSPTPSPTAADVKEAHRIGDGINAILVPCETLYYGTNRYRSNIILGTKNSNPCTIMKFGPGVDWMTRYNNGVFAANKSGNRQVYLAEQKNGQWTWTASSSSLSGADGIFAGISFEGYFTNLPVSTSNPIGVDVKTLTEQQTITLSWIRPDGETLTTSFSIEVTA